ncbi:iron complex transport system substrate-binding protein [Palleronia aestuarii]|uniref:Iron complex transport system substrate-binding protein n=1 Tax=Palleronia aestuarii TaxID=568105 RepID=A0A2W7NAL0_9RHOB|nr:hypothetical protein [Palleronia aestuarii]PZX15117.1 iron complex transport system substrate-binding protein [Palleronia aestuarii]
MDLFDDVVVTHGDRNGLEKMAENPLITQFPAVARDAVALIGDDAIGATANPTPLSLDAYLGLLSRAASR